MKNYLFIMLASLLSVACAKIEAKYGVSTGSSSSNSQAATGTVVNTSTSTYRLVPVDANDVADFNASLGRSESGATYSDFKSLGNGTYTQSLVYEGSSQGSSSMTISPKDLTYDGSSYKNEDGSQALPGYRCVIEVSGVSHVIVRDDNDVGNRDVCTTYAGCYSFGRSDVRAKKSNLCKSAGQNGPIAIFPIPGAGSE